MSSFAKASDPSPAFACPDSWQHLTLHRSLFFLPDSLPPHSRGCLYPPEQPLTLSLEGCFPATCCCSDGALIGGVGDIPGWLLLPMPRALSYSCDSKHQLMTSKSFSPAQLSLLNSQVYPPAADDYGNPHLHKPQTPTFHCVLRRAHHVPPHLFPVLGLLPKCGAGNQRTAPLSYTPLKSIHLFFRV